MPVTAEELRAEILRDYVTDVSYKKIQDALKRPQRVTKTTKFDDLEKAVKAVVKSLSLHKPGDEPDTAGKYPIPGNCRRVLSTGKRKGEYCFKPVIYDGEKLTDYCRNHIDKTVSGEEQSGGLSLDELHAVAGFAKMEEAVPASKLVFELDMPLEIILDLAGANAMAGPETVVDGAVVRAAVAKRAEHVAPGQGGTMVRYNARAANVAMGSRGGRRRWTTQQDKALIDELFGVIALILRTRPYRPDQEKVELERKKVKGTMTIVGVNIPSLLNPKHLIPVDPMEHQAMKGDDEASYPVLDESQEATLVAKMSQLSVVPNQCQNCLESERFRPLLRSKFWLLVDGNKDGLRFHLPGKRRETIRLYKELGIPTDKLKEIGFRKVHDDCGIIASEMKELAFGEFDGVSWFDPEVQQQFVVALGAAMRPRLPELKDKMGDDFDRGVIKHHVQEVGRIIFGKLGESRANRQAAGRREARSA